MLVDHVLHHRFVARRELHGVERLVREVVEIAVGRNAAVAGLAGATLRIPNSFMIAICGGRNVKAMTSVLLLLPAVGAGFALRNPDTPFLIYIVLGMFLKSLAMRVLTIPVVIPVAAALEWYLIWFVIIVVIAL